MLNVYLNGLGIFREINRNFK